MKQIFRYTILNLDLNYAYEIETNRLYKVGQKIYAYDTIDHKTYAMRIVRIEGTAYNKTKEQLLRERTDNQTAAA